MSYRVIFALLIAGSTLTVGYGYVAGPAGATFESHLQRDGIIDSNAQIVPPRDNITVIATDSNAWLGRASGGPRARGELVAFNPDGSTLYYNDSHTRYWDVDPVPGTRTTVEYMFSDHLNESACPDDWDHSRRRVDEEVWTKYREVIDERVCTRNGFERVNLSTGDVTRVWTEITPGKENTRYHDADRLNATHIAVADIYLDRVFVVDTRDGRTEWTWNASSAFPTDTGGPYPEDWTHINDVEVLEDGRIMVSVRNQDRVVFLNRTGVVKEWTLGAEDNRTILYEQHNPDFFPAKRGGPSAVVADSENNRVVEYQRTNGTWTRTWVWTDARMKWPRDADRLPNGHTLITDSNGNRVFEVNQRGEIVWSVTIAFPYEAERLSTGDESTGGPSAQQADLESYSGTVTGGVWILLKQAIPGRYMNGIVYATPVWMGLPELVALVVGVVSGISWLGVELK